MDCMAQRCTCPGNTYRWEDDVDVRPPWKTIVALTLAPWKTMVALTLLSVVLSVIFKGAPP